MHQQLSYPYPKNLILWFFMHQQLSYPCPKNLTSLVGLPSSAYFRGSKLSPIRRHTSKEASVRTATVEEAPMHSYRIFSFWSFLRKKSRLDRRKF
jgi:hypothetical protein